MSNGRMSAAPRNACWTLLFPAPQDCGQVPVHPRKSSRDSVAAAFQGLWKITTHIWHPASPLTTLFRHQRMWPFSGVYWAQVASSLYQISFQQWNHFSLCGPRTSRTPLCSWGFTFPTRAPPGMELWSHSLLTFALPLFTVLMEFKPSPFSFLPF